MFPRRSLAPAAPSFATLRKAASSVLSLQQTERRSALLARAGTMNHVAYVLRLQQASEDVASARSSHPAGGAAPTAFPLTTLPPLHLSLSLNAHEQQSHVSTSSSPSAAVIAQIVRAASELVDQISARLLASPHLSASELQEHVLKIVCWARDLSDQLLLHTSNVSAQSPRSDVSSSLSMGTSLITDCCVALMQTTLRKLADGDRNITSGMALVGSVANAWINNCHVQHLGHIWQAVERSGVFAAASSSAAAQQQQQLDRLVFEAAHRLKRKLNFNQQSDAAVCRQLFVDTVRTFVAPALSYLEQQILLIEDNRQQQEQQQQQQQQQRALARRKELVYFAGKLLSCLKHAPSEETAAPVLAAANRLLHRNAEAASLVLQSLSPSVEMWDAAASASSDASSAAPAQAQLSSSGSGRPSHQLATQVYELVTFCLREANKADGGSAVDSALVEAAEHSSSSAVSDSDGKGSQQASPSASLAVRLYIGIRNGAKILHFAREYGALASLYDNSESARNINSNGSNNSSGGGAADRKKEFLVSWHVADALLQLGRPYDAARAIDAFLLSTRDMFLERIPRAINNVVFAIAAALGRTGNNASGGVDGMAAPAADALALLEASRAWNLTTLRPANVLRTILQGAEEHCEQWMAATLAARASDSGGSNGASTQFPFDIVAVMQWAAATPGVMTVPASQIAAMRIAIYSDLAAARSNHSSHRDGGDDDTAEADAGDHGEADDNGFESSATQERRMRTQQARLQRRAQRQSALRQVVASLCAKSATYHTEELERQLFVRAIRALVSAGQFAAAVKVLAHCAPPERAIVPMGLLDFELRRGIEQQLRDGVHGGGGGGTDTTVAAPQTLLAADAIEELEQHLESVNAWVRDAKDSRAAPSSLQQQQQQRWTCRSTSCAFSNAAANEACGRCDTLREPAWVCSACSMFVIGGAKQREAGANEDDTDDLASCSRRCTVCDAQRDPARSPLLTVSPWRCAGCGTANSTQHPHFCGKCGGSNPLLQAHKIQPYSCTVCAFVNDRGILRPWCARCGSLHAAVDRSGAVAHLWSCNTCATLVPWLHSRCTGCRAHRPSSASAPAAAGGDTAVVSWATWDCAFCSAVNPPWSTGCRSCKRVMQRPTSSAAATEESTSDNTSSVSARATCRVCGFAALADLGQKGHWCARCGSALYRASRASIEASSLSSSAALQQGGGAPLFWFVEMIEAAVRGDPVTDRNALASRRDGDDGEDDLEGDAALALAAHTNADAFLAHEQRLRQRRAAKGGVIEATSATATKARAANAPLPLEHPLSRDTLMWVCSAPSLCLAANLISDRACRKCGASRPKNAAALSISKYKLADEYLLRVAGGSGASNSPLVPVDNNSNAGLLSLQLKLRLDDVQNGQHDDEEAEMALEQKQRELNDAIAERVDAAAAAMPPLLARSYSRACPKCSAINNGNSKRLGSNNEKSSGWCDARSLAGFCTGCMSFSAPLPAPVEFAAADKDDDNALRLWAALRLAVEMCCERSDITAVQALAMLESLADMLDAMVVARSASAPEGKSASAASGYPWQGFDIAVRGFPDTALEPVVISVDPATRDVVETPHSALRGLVDKLLLRLVAIARDAAPSSKDDDSDEAARARRCALRIVAVVNRSTSFDEIGFSTLLALARCFERRDGGVAAVADQEEQHCGRPAPAEKPWERWLRIRYLSQMRLEPADIVGDSSFCITCCRRLCHCRCATSSSSSTRRSTAQGAASDAAHSPSTSARGTRIASASAERLQQQQQQVRRPAPPATADAEPKSGKQQRSAAAAAVVRG